jgi:hypothetical protein
MPKGIRIGGRQKGTPNKFTAERKFHIAETQRKIAEYLGSSVFPGDSVDLLVSIYKNAELPLAIRLDAASKAAPYERPKLQTITVQHDEKPAIEIQHFYRQLPVVQEAVLLDSSESSSPKVDSDGTQDKVAAD